MKKFDEWFRENGENAFARNFSRYEIAKQAYEDSHEEKDAEIKRLRKQLAEKDAEI